MRSGKLLAIEASKGERDDGARGGRRVAPPPELPPDPVSEILLRSGDRAQRNRTDELLVVGAGNRIDVLRAGGALAVLTRDPRLGHAVAIRMRNDRCRV